MKQLNWAVLGTGWIASEMAQVFLDGGRVVYGVGSRTAQKAEAFAKQYHIPTVYQDFHDMFKDENVNAVYIATPHNSHFAYIMEALSYGKHVLCEKAITLNSRELETAEKLAKEKNLILAEAMTIYHMPLYCRLRELVHSAALGNIHLIQANFGSVKEYDMSNRFFNPQLAGGALLDIGVYALSLVRSFMQACPCNIDSQVQYAPSGVDEGAGIVLSNQKGQMGVISLSLHTKQPKRCVICGEKGYIEIVDYPRADTALFYDSQSGDVKTIREGNTQKALLYEIEAMEKAVAGEGDMLFSYTKDVMKLMTKLRMDWNIWYPEEKQDKERMEKTK